MQIDWALDGPVPFTNAECRQAGTVHLRNTYEEIAATPRLPFVLFAQQSVFDETRTLHGYYTASGYCHVPNGSTTDMTTLIEAQVERFAPGFKKRIISRHIMNTTDMQQYNPNYIGGDINGGFIDLRQLYARPVITFPISGNVHWQAVGSRWKWLFMRNLGIPMRYFKKSISKSYSGIKVFFLIPINIDNGGHMAPIVNI